MLALAAAIVHASWNLLIAGSEDTHSAAAVAITVGVLLFAPLAVLHWRLSVSAVPYVLGSSLLESVYLLLLATGYSVAEMSFVYPIARGSAPVLVLIVSAAVLGASVSPAAAGGVLLIAAGIVLVRGLRVSARPRDLALALAVGACIAGYTLVDKRGIQHGAPIAYLEVVFGLTAVTYLVGTLRSRGTRALRRAVRFSTVVAGAGFFGSYALALAALRLAPAASVAAVRESSVVIATVALAIGGREAIGAGRLAGAAVVVAGIALIALG
jgi:drug/metabolite transporter (DMT)-like permease